MKILIPIASHDFDPSEAAISWKILRDGGASVVFATPDGKPGAEDPRMLTGKGLGPWAPMLRADAWGIEAYREMERSEEFRHPIAYEAIRAEEYDGMLLPGGHAPGMRDYLEAPALQKAVGEFADTGRPLGAICHGVVLAARSRSPRTGESILRGKKTTALTAWQELSAWALTCLWLGSYYRTYPTTVEAEVRQALGPGGEFLRGPMSSARDAPDRLDRGFTVRDGNYVSARWPGDAHRFATEFLAMVRGAHS